MTSQQNMTQSSGRTSPPSTARLSPGKRRVSHHRAFFYKGPTLAAVLAGEKQCQKFLLHKPNIMTKVFEGSKGGSMAYENSSELPVGPGTDRAQLHRI